MRWYQLPWPNGPISDVFYSQRLGHRSLRQGCYTRCKVVSSIKELSRYSNWLFWWYVCTSFSLLGIGSYRPSTWAYQGLTPSFCTFVCSMPTLTVILTADIPSLRPMLQNYLACGDDAADAADFFSLNVYEWCGESSFDGSGYSQLVTNATGLQIPIFISETGCRIPKPRTFDDQDSILGTDMENTWSGAIVYEWIEESNDYGLISYGPKVDPMSNTAALDGYTRSGTPSPVTPDYSNLKGHWATLHPTGVALSAYSASAASLTAIACPSMTPNGWVVNPTASLPSLGETLDLAATSTGGLQSGKPTSTAKKGAAAAMKPASVMMGGNEVAGMGISLICVMLGFLFWL